MVVQRAGVDPHAADPAAAAAARSFESPASRGAVNLKGKDGRAARRRRARGRREVGWGGGGEFLPEDVADDSDGGGGVVDGVEEVARDHGVEGPLRA